MKKQIFIQSDESRFKLGLEPIAEQYIGGLLIETIITTHLHKPSFLDKLAYLFALYPYNDGNYGTIETTLTNLQLILTDLNKIQKELTNENI